ncbi:alpha-galactosidase [Kitasatospora atroaurantiaca]|uniref:Alpha-galactosidase n=1 Tax=Kitasatospora atroaurantiaca TaxID=285545 RepID=A0A561EJZ4_9ACTN|nr:alpha-galactosidase [Kitasatospora atroaurantiaca]TWE15935.1 alpha-galactosidase [Kitasatospora atroaurantiaca]
MVESQVVVLSADGVALVLDVTGPGLPRVLHWGADLGVPAEDGAQAFAALDDARPSAPRRLIPFQGEGWFGRPALAGHRDGAVRPPRFALSEPVSVRARAGAGGTVEVRAADPGAGLELHCTVELTPEGVARIRHTVTNTAPTPYTLDGLACLLPIPAHATELLDFAGRWARERSPQRAPLRHGLWSRESRRGRTGFDAGLLIAGTEGFGFRRGEVWGVHTAWSGNHVQYAERSAGGHPVIGGGELLEAGEIRLAEGESYRAPWVHFGTSDAGLDGLSRRFHRLLRARPQHPRTPRPVTLNIWEAVYFDHSPEKLLGLADTAASVGVERFVVDDGWFRHRRHDRAGLGDWYVDETVWPEGLHALAERVHGHGMQFGLWFEPEMANPDSDLLRAHPDWLLADPERLPYESRNQQVLDVARPEAFAYLLERISTLIGEYGIDYLKWDHNRDLADAVHDGRPGVHAQTLAVYRLIDELRSLHPGLEIESCSSGGARVDLGILERTDRIWGSDNIDPLERQAIQRWTGLLVPHELIGSHVGASPAHISGRASELAFRCATALFGHAGIEADVSTWPEQDRAALRAWIASYKRLRPLLHGGDTVRVDHPDQAAWVHGVVSADRAHAVFAYVQLDTSVSEAGAPIRFAGLDPDARYALTVLPELSAPEASWPLWARREPVPLPGRFLSEAGVAAPDLVDRPGQALVVELRAAG